MATKKSTMKTEDRVPQGQGGPRIQLAQDDMNTDELAVMRALIRAPKGPVALADLIKTTRRSSLEVRNALRRLVRGRWVLKAGRGLYAPSAMAINKFVDKKKAA